MFGIPLEKTLLDKEGNATSDIPLVVADTIKMILFSQCKTPRQIVQNEINSWLGYLEEGIFRLSCSHIQLQTMKRLYDLSM